MGPMLFRSTIVGARYLWATSLQVEDFSLGDHGRSQPFRDSTLPNTSCDAPADARRAQRLPGGESLGSIGAQAGDAVLVDTCLP